MKYYSELTKQLYETKEDLQKAEIAVTKSKADRAERAKAVTEAIQKATKATKEADKLLREFIKDYGSFKTTIKDEDVKSMDSLFWDAFNNFLF